MFADDISLLNSGVEKDVILELRYFGEKLVNMTNGDEGISGCKLSDEAKAKISIAKKGNNNILGKTHSKETKEKISAIKKGNTYRLGKTHSEESKEKMSIIKGKLVNIYKKDTNEIQETT